MKIEFAFRNLHEKARIPCFHEGKVHAGVQLLDIDFLTKAFLKRRNLPMLERPSFKSNQKRKEPEGSFLMFS